MKPRINNVDNRQRSDLSGTISTGRSYPLTDFHYHANAITDFAGHCGNGRAKNFRKISTDYFNKEARGNFVTEAGVFALIAITAAVPILISVRAGIEFLRAIGTL